MAHLSTHLALLTPPSLASSGCCCRFCCPLSSPSRPQPMSIHHNLFLPWACRCVLPPTKTNPLKTAVSVTLPRWTTHHSSKSPQLNNINSLLAKINLPTLQYDNVMMDLGPTRGRNETGVVSLNNPCDLQPPPKANNQITSPVSPTGIEPGYNMQVSKAGDDSGGDPTPNTLVRINDTPTSNPPRTNPTHFSMRQAPQSILHYTPAMPTEEATPPQLPRPLHPTTH
jgi:hypothetical protein